MDNREESKLTYEEICEIMGIEPDEITICEDGIVLEFVGDVF